MGTRSCLEGQFSRREVYNGNSWLHRNTADGKASNPSFSTGYCRHTIQRFFLRWNKWYASRNSLWVPSLIETKFKVYLQFEWYTHKPGLVIVTCSSQSSHGLIKNYVQLIREQETMQVQLNIFEENEFLCLEVMISSSKLLQETKLDRAPNESLKTKKWIVFHRTYIKYSQLLTFSWLYLCRTLMGETVKKRYSLSFLQNVRWKRNPKRLNPYKERHSNG